MLWLVSSRMACGWAVYEEGEGRGGEASTYDEVGRKGLEGKERKAASEEAKARRPSRKESERASERGEISPGPPVRRGKSWWSLSVRAAGSLISTAFVRGERGDRPPAFTHSLHSPGHDSLQAVWPSLRLALACVGARLGQSIRRTWTSPGKIARLFPLLPHSASPSLRQVPPSFVPRSVGPSPSLDV